MHEGGRIHRPINGFVVLLSAIWLLAGIGLSGCGSSGVDSGNSPDPCDPSPLRFVAARCALEIIGQLPNDARPEEIGKPNENLFGVRFESRLRPAHHWWTPTRFHHRSGSTTARCRNAFIHGDTVYYVREGKVWGSFWGTPSQVHGPY